MRFLVVSKSRQALPMEAAAMLVEAMKGWARQNTANKTFEQVWGFAGIPSGGVIVNVNSVEELDVIMAEFPFGQFSETEIYALTDLDESLANAANALKKMMSPKM